jgi:uncharacterized damage-inducible protein DinB
MAERLTLSPHDARAILEYDRAVFDRFVRRVRRLPRKEAFRRRGIGHESLFDTLVHVLNVTEVWLVYVVRGRNSERELSALFEEPRRHPTDWKGFDAYAEEVWSGAETTIRDLSDRTLGRTVKAFWMPGHYTVRDVLWQTTLEEAHHLGEVIGALWQDDRAPPDMTWIDVRRPPARRRRRS